MLFQKTLEKPYQTTNFPYVHIHSHVFTCFTYVFYINKKS